MDGVLCHTDKFHYRAWKMLADKLAIAFDERANDSLRGVSREESLEIVLAHGGGQYTPAQKAAFAQEKNALYCESLRRMSPADVSEKVRSALHTLRQNGKLLAVGSSSKNAPLILERIGLNHFFDAVVEGNMLQHSKPHPEVFLRAAALLNVPPQQCAVVEDAHAGIAAAKAAGMYAIALGPAADAAIVDLAALPEIVAESRTQRQRGCG